MSILLDKVDPEVVEEEWIPPSQTAAQTTSPGQEMRGKREGNRNKSRAHTRWAQCLTLAAEHETHGASRP